MVDHGITTAPRITCNWNTTGLMARLNRLIALREPFLLSEALLLSHFFNNFYLKINIIDCKCILSNALPIFADTNSVELGLLLNFSA